jgi:hypothetical protein
LDPSPLQPWLPGPPTSPARRRRKPTEPRIRLRRSNVTVGTQSCVQAFDFLPALVGEADYHGVFRLRVLLAGLPALGQLDQLTVTIRDDVHTRGEAILTAGGPTRDQIKRQIWGSYRFPPGTGPDEARADETGRGAYEGVLPVGDALICQLESNPPPPWSKWTPEKWQASRGPCSGSHSLPSRRAWVRGD